MHACIFVHATCKCTYWLQLQLLTYACPLLNCRHLSLVSPLTIARAGKLTRRIDASTVATVDSWTYARGTCAA